MKIRYLGGSAAQIHFGNCDDPTDLLVVGQEYELLRKQVHSWHTKILLAEHPDKVFNSVLFESTDPK